MFDNIFFININSMPAGLVNSSDFLDMDPETAAAKTFTL